MCMNNQKFMNFCLAIAFALSKCDEPNKFIIGAVYVLRCAARYIIGEHNRANMIKIELNRDNWDQFQMMKYVNAEIAKTLYIINEHAV